MAHRNGERVRDKEACANSPGDIAEETEVDTCHKVGKPTARLRGGQHIRDVCCQRGKAVEIG